MSFKRWKNFIVTVFIFIIVLITIGYIYGYFNGNSSTQQTMIEFIKKDGLKTLFTAVFVMFGLYILWCVTKGKIKRR